MSASGQNCYRFESFELDGAWFELRCDGDRVAVEPQVLDLLLLLVANAGRLVSRDELVNAIWDGRIISESAIAARIKAARKAIGDDGSAQRLIRTVHGKGFRFVGEVKQDAHAHIFQPPPESPPPSRDTRPSIAVLPFALVGEAGPHDIIADALPADIISDLARLPWLFVIARGSSFRFRGADTDPRRVGERLGVRYCLTGVIETTGHSATIAAALVETEAGSVLWSDRFTCALVELQQMRPEILAQVVGALESRIQHHEVRLARERPAADLDAWAAFHLGLDHMFRFTRADNARAAQLFAHSLAGDPHFSRALGGLSFTHFQNAFLHHAEDPDGERAAARELASRAVEADRLDPFGYFNLGRSLWLDGELDQSVEWFDRSTALSPSFAQGVYNRGLVNTMAGRAEAADADLALALELSPLDPLAYAMVSSRALTALQMGDIEESARRAATAARMPGAHKHIELIAGLTAHLVGRTDEAQQWLAKARAADPDLGSETFFRAFPFAQNKAREQIERSLADLGL